MQDFLGDGWLQVLGGAYRAISHGIPVTFPSQPLRVRRMSSQCRGGRPAPHTARQNGSNHGKWGTGEGPMSLRHARLSISRCISCPCPYAVRLLLASCTVIAGGGARGMPIAQPGDESSIAGKPIKSALSAWGPHGFLIGWSWTLGPERADDSRKREEKGKKGTGGLKTKANLGSHDPVLMGLGSARVVCPAICHLPPATDLPSSIYHLQSSLRRLPMQCKNYQYYSCTAPSFVGASPFPTSYLGRRPRD
ncbi:hypothetical protein B0T26DRAFT_312713 [Lasiosphaeria miniovina]|uniref:Uncharacterized protein n=1 Tax=Lasiosphaeria miniovina TaxID=1954250 RepID=A0AA40ALK0_9PEZI|nr:uncharacterized protein B0T26DRAFT_312713 [Lasiosphaeria miniovina]KAK0718090.1 hypothetical protein B0T26DRAFT_312713 [Lasiosphaeria miniovina]